MTLPLPDEIARLRKKWPTSDPYAYIDLLTDFGNALDALEVLDDGVTEAISNLTALDESVAWLEDMSKSAAAKLAGKGEHNGT